MFVSLFVDVYVGDAGDHVLAAGQAGRVETSVFSFFLDHEGLPSLSNPHRDLDW